MTKENRFIIISPPRTGSTLLRTMLNSVPELICHGELYALKRVLGVSHHKKSKLSRNELFRLRTINEPMFWSTMGFEAENKVGFKILYEQFLSVSAANILNLLDENPGIKIIHLWSKHLLIVNITGIKPIR